MEKPTIKINVVKKTIIDIVGAKISLNQGNSFYLEKKYSAAIKAYKKALKLHNQEYYKNRSELFPQKAKVETNLGVSLYMLGMYKRAIKAYKKAQNTYSHEYCQQHDELASSRASLEKNLGIAYYSNRNYSSAIIAYKTAQKIYSQKHCKNQKKLDPSKASTSLNLGATYYLLGDYPRAMKAYKRAQKILERKFCMACDYLDPSRANLNMNIGIIYAITRKYPEAEQFLKKSKMIHNQAFCKNRKELDPNRLNTEMNLANLYHVMRNYSESEKTYKIAERIGNNEYCKKLNELKILRVRIALNLGATLLSMKKYNLAIESLKNAQRILSDEFCKKRSEFDPDRAKIARGLGNLFRLTHDYPSALKSFMQSLKIYTKDNFKNSNTLIIISEECQLYESASTLLSHMENPLHWALNKSQRLVELLELAPESGAIENDKILWEPMRISFHEFHNNWLKFVIKHKKYGEIPKILFAMQGRELAAEVLDLTEDNVQNYKIPNEIKNYQKTRNKLRKITQKSILNSLDRSLNSSFVNFNQHDNSPKHGGKYQKQYHQLILDRAEATKVSGYEFLQPNSNDLSLQNIQANQQLKTNQALLILISLKGTQGLLLIKKNGKPIWIEIKKLKILVYKLDKFNKSVKHNKNKLFRSNYTKNRQQYRRNISDNETIIESIFKPKNINDFWSKFRRSMAVNLWKPLAQYLVNLDELIILPHRLLHQLPIEIGKPTNLKLKFYPGLIFYALKNGLIKENKVKDFDKNIEYYDLGLLSYNDKKNENNHLNELSKEINSIQSLYSIKQYQKILCPDPFPIQKLKINLLHFAGHGGIDPGNKNSTVLEVGKNKYLGHADIIQGKSQVNHLFINACTTGQIKENSQGTPMSIVTGFMRNGTHSITAAQSPISDELASYFAPLWHRNWIANNYSNPNLTLDQTKEEFANFINKEYLPSQKEEVEKYLQLKLDGNIVNSKEVNDVLHDLAIFYYLSKKQTINLHQIFENFNQNNQRAKLSEKIIGYLSDLNRFKLNITQNIISPDVGTILFTMRCYG